VPVLNREKDIGECLDSLLAVDYPSFEIIVVDNGSTDGTREVTSKYPVKTVLESSRGAYRARNKGIARAQGEIVAFTDSDCVVDRNWLRKLAESYSDETVGGVGGLVSPYKTDRLIGEFASLGPQEIFQSPQRVKIKQSTKSFPHSALGSGNMSFRKEILLEVGGFFEELIACADYDLCWKVQRAGYQLIYEPEAIVYHKPRTSLSELIRQYYGLGVSEPKLLTVQRDVLSYIEFKTYLFPTYQFRRKLPIQALITVDFFILGTLSLLLILFDPRFVILPVALGGMCLRQAWARAKEASGCAKRARLLILFPILHAGRCYARALGRFVGGLASGVISF